MKKKVMLEWVSPYDFQRWDRENKKLTDPWIHGVKSEGSIYKKKNLYLDACVEGLEKDPF